MFKFILKSTQWLLPLALRMLNVLEIMVLF
uniref:Uncharacterized protein n=1 Tax=Arundo donax TaxID=35708 RepID=A0A0A9GYU0_ARUDO